MGPWRPPARSAIAPAARMAATPALHDPLKQCNERWRNATLDHFSWSASEVPGARTFKQRYYVCPKVRRARQQPHDCMNACPTDTSPRAPRVAAHAPLYSRKAETSPGASTARNLGHP